MRKRIVRLIILPLATKRHQFVSTSSDGQMMFWDTRFPDKDKKKHGPGGKPRTEMDPGYRPDYVNQIIYK